MVKSTAQTANSWRQSAFSIATMDILSIQVTTPTLVRGTRHGTRKSHVAQVNVELSNISALQIVEMKNRCLFQTRYLCDLCILTKTITKRTWGGKNQVC